MLSDYHVSVKGLITRGTEILLLRSGGVWDLPGGRLEAGEAPLDGLRREVGEELPGVASLSIGELVGWGTNRDYLVPERELVVLIFGVVATLPSPVQLSEEHDEAVWLSLADAQDALNMVSIHWERVSLG